MKVKYIIVLFVVSLLVLGIGALAKLQHWPWAGQALIGGMLLQSTSYILAIIKALTMKKYKDFLNS
ncbi:MAG: hypothetical protein IT257_07190 [Chitinophagaceae bacterium]|nr:hypothetical protein [Chitinophagaceae bacterium]